MVLGNFKKRLQLRAWSRYLRLATMEHSLRYLFWEATLACNLRCLHCGSDCSSAKDTRLELTTEEIIGGFESVAGRYDPKGIMVAITGGEPLLRKDIFAVTERISALGFPWGMVTNGFAMTEEAIEKCRATGMSTVTVSLDGLKEDHNWLRRNADSFDRAVGAIRALGDRAFLSGLEVATTVSRRTVDKLPDIHEFIEKEGVREWRLITLFPGGRAKGNYDLLLRPGDYRKLYEFARDARKAGAPMRVSVDEEGFLGCETRKGSEGRLLQLPGGHRDRRHPRARGDIGLPQRIEEARPGQHPKGIFRSLLENKFQPFRDRQWMRQGAAGTARNGGYARETASTCGISTRTHRTSVTSTAFTARSVYENYRSIGKKAVQLQEDRLAVPMWYAAAVG